MGAMRPRDGAAAPTGARTSSVRRSVVRLVAAGALTVLAACNPDPTGGARPPLKGATGVPPYSTSVRPVARAAVQLSWREGCPVHYTALRTVQVAYWGYDGARHVGDIVVHQRIAPQIQGIFNRLYANRFQVRRVHPVELYGADDNRSMAANNTSGFNCRRVAGSSSWSQHAYGTAIDVNPIQNPYVRGSSVSPPAGRSWVDRRSVTPGMATAGDPLVAAFDSISWGWGGRWTSGRDYQHFSQNGR